MTGIEQFINVSTVMRPCDGTSGLVRGNRRKAVFALKGLFSKGICHVFALGQRFLLRIPEVRGKSETTEHNPIFCNKTAGRGSAKLRSGRPISFLPRTSGIAARKYAANSGAHEHTALFAQRNRRYRRCCIPVCSASFEFAAYFRFLPLWRAASTYIIG